MLEGNTIAFNSPGGVRIQSPGTGNAVLSNSIFSNNGLGIDLEPNGVTANDPGDGDTGANNRQNFPVLTLAASGSTVIEGTLNSTPNTQFRIEFFSNSACDPSGHGEGETPVGATMVTTDGSGNVAFGVILGATVPVGHFITSTATDPDNNTSEFSQCIAVTPPPPDEEINIHVNTLGTGAKQEGTCWRVFYDDAVAGKVEHDVVGDNVGGVKPDCGEPSNLKLSDSDPAAGLLRITIPSEQRVQFGDIWHVQNSFSPVGKPDPNNYECDLSLGKCDIPKVAVGGIFTDLDPTGSGGSAGLLAGVIAGATAAAIAIASAAWYARRRWLA
jgi:hypothetical protein